MKTFYAILAIGSLVLLQPIASQAARRPATDEPTEAARKAPNREKAVKAAAAKAAKATHKKNSAHHMRRLSAGLNHAFMVFLGLEDSKAVTSPRKLNRLLHVHQKHLKVKARLEAKARRRRTDHMFHH